MNRSKIFNGEYEKYDNGNGDNRSDYYDKKNNRYIDVKIMFEKELIESFAKENYNDFVNELKSQTSLYVDETLNNLENNRFFKIIENILINKIDENEDCILFLPLPIELDTRDSFFYRLGQDNILICYLRLKKKYKDKLRDKDVYYIVFTDNNYVCIRKISDDKSSNWEYLDTDVFVNRKLIN